MKKFILLLTVAFILGSFSACSGDSDTETADQHVASTVLKANDSTEIETTSKTAITQSTEAQTTVDSSKTSKKNVISGAASETKPASSQVQKTKRTTKPASGNTAQKELQRGSISGNTYRNDFSGITFTKPDDWHYATDDEMEETLSAGMEMFDVDGSFDFSAELTTVYDMMVVEPRSGSSINISYENLKKSNAVSMPMDDYLAALQEALNSAMASMNYEFSDSTTKQLGNQTYYHFVATTSLYGQEIRQGLYFRKQGDYMIGITMTVTGDVSFQQMEAMFS